MPGRKSEGKKPSGGAHLTTKRFRAFGRTAQVECHSFFSSRKQLAHDQPVTSDNTLRTMPVYVYQILHLLSLLVLIGGTFYGFAGAPQTRKKILLTTGIASLLMLVSGFGLLSKLHANQISLWVILKLIAWLGLSALAGIGYRKRDQAPLFLGLTLALATLALISVYVIRFHF